MPRKKQIGTRLAKHPSEVVAERAHSLGESPGAYIELVVQWWLAQGAPALSAYEAHLLAQKRPTKERLAEPVSHS